MSEVIGLLNIPYNFHIATEKNILGKWFNDHCLTQVVFCMFHLSSAVFHIVPYPPHCLYYFDYPLLKWLMRSVAVIIPLFRDYLGVDADMKSQASCLTFHILICTKRKRTMHNFPSTLKWCATLCWLSQIKKPQCNIFKFVVTAFGKS